MTPGDSDGWRLNGCAAAMVIGWDQVPVRQTENRNAAGVSPCGASQLSMTPPSGRDVTLGEKLPLGTGDGISHSPIPVSDSIRLEWQPDRKQQKKINAKSFTIALAFPLSKLLN